MSLLICRCVCHYVNVSAIDIHQHASTYINVHTYQQSTHQYTYVSANDIWIYVSIDMQTHISMQTCSRYDTSTYIRISNPHINKHTYQQSTHQYTYVSPNDIWIYVSIDMQTHISMQTCSRYDTSTYIRISNPHINKHTYHRSTFESMFLLTCRHISLCKRVRDSHTSTYIRISNPHTNVCPS